MKISGSDVRTGNVIEWQDKLWLVIKHEIRTPGNLRGFNQVEMKDILTGTKQNIRLSSDEKVEKARLESHEYNFLFADGDMLTFMNNDTYEQVQLDKEMVGDALLFLQDNMTVTIGTHEGRALSVELPERVTMEITEADPVVKGQTASSSYKPAILENGVKVLVPPFIEAGTRIVVNTRDNTYVERAKD